MLRKLFRPLESQGSTTSVWPTFSIRTARFDCQLCSMAPSRLIPQPIGDRQFVPSIVPPCTTMYLCSPLVTVSTWLLATSPGWAFEAQGSSALPGPEAAAGLSAANAGEHERSTIVKEMSRITVPLSSSIQDVLQNRRPQKSLPHQVVLPRCPKLLRQLRSECFDHR